MLTFTALADPTRRRIVEMLARLGRLPVSKIRMHFPISPPAISQHLKVLKQAKLVRVEVNAQQRIYSLDPDGISEMEQWVAELRRTWDERFDKLDALLKKEMKKAQLGDKNDRETTP